jgi:AcrR family transcriptional regulator
VNTINETNGRKHFVEVRATRVTMSRRERVREHTRDEIKAIARQQMAEQGTAALNLAAIARQMEMTAPALYRYFADRDALVTALIVDAFASASDAIEAASASLPAEHYAERMRAVMEAYRAWALANPVDFQLIYGNPIPGYHAPAELTVPQVRRTTAAILHILQAAYTAGRLRLPPELQSPPRNVQLHVSDSSGMTPTMFPALLYVCMAGWTRIHGIVMLELFNHLQPTVGDVGAFFRHEVEQFLSSVGFTLPDSS